MLPRENLKFKSSETARNAYKAANSNAKFKLSHPLKTTSYDYIYNLDRTVYQNLNE